MLNRFAEGGTGDLQVGSLRLRGLQGVKGTWGEGRVRLTIKATSFSPQQQWIEGLGRRRVGTKREGRRDRTRGRRGKGRREGGVAYRIHLA